MGGARARQPVDNSVIKESVKVQKEHLDLLKKNSKTTKWISFGILILSLCSLISIWYLNYNR